MEKVSVIVPVYNTEEFLDDCIQSIINQSYKKLEIIIINDHSTDGSLDKISQYANDDERIKVINNKERQGVGASRNIGVNLATGEFIYFVDSDDLLHEDAIKHLVENIGEHEFISGSMSTFKNQDDIDSFEEKNNGLLMRKSTKLFRTRSVLKVLFRRDYLINNNLKHGEEVSHYSDYYLMYDVISNYKKVPYYFDSRYFKRKRNDPINSPALNQYERYDKIINYLKMYKDVNQLYDSDRIKKIIDRDLLNFYRKVVVMYMENPDQFDEIFEQLHVAFLLLNQNSYKKLNIVVKKEIVSIIKNDKEKYKKLMALHHNLRAIKRSVRSKRNFYTYLHRKVFLKKDIEPNLVVFESFMGKSYSCNPKYIYEYLLEHKPDMKFVWIYRDKPLDIIGNPKQVKRFSLKYYYYMARAKYWVFNSRIPKHVRKKEGNIYLQTWHGTPLKTLVFDIKDIYSANPNYKRDFYLQSRRWDYLISPNAYSSEIFRRAFKFEKTMLEYGYPRNDILYNGDENLINEIKSKINIPKDKKVILYAPTWRDDQFYERGKYKFELNLNLEKMRQELSDEYIIILRLHYHVASVLDVSEFKGFAYDLSTYDDIAELYLISDILITDYSSVFFDYANLRRPMLFYTYDLENYRDKIRGLYFDIETEVPGPLLRTTDQVIHAVQNIESIQSEYSDKYDKFYKRFCEWEDGKASENVVREVFKI